MIWVPGSALNSLINFWSFRFFLVLGGSFTAHVRATDAILPHPFYYSHFWRRKKHNIPSAINCGVWNHACQSCQHSPQLAGPRTRMWMPSTGTANGNLSCRQFIFQPGFVAGESIFGGLCAPGSPGTRLPSAPNPVHNLL